jgi:hypothetical protein
MPFIKNLFDTLSKAGFVPTILVLGGWIYTAILFFVFLYSLIFHKTKYPPNKDKKN